ncbi:NAD-glutamate dehydrogenase [Oleiagrimonas citrea]
MNQAKHMEADRFLGQVREHVERLSAQSKEVDLAQLQVLSDGFFSRMAQIDRDQHAPEEWAALLLELHGFMATRPFHGRAHMRIFNPIREQAGWGGLRTTVQVVTDDMPFLVDTLTMAVARAELDVHMVAHPVFAVLRETDGTLQELSQEGIDQPHESIMHLEIDRLADDDACERLRDELEASLSDVRLAVEDWQRMRGMMLDISEDLPRRELPLDEAAVSEAQSFLRWAADDNFTFLGYREYEVADVDGDEVLRTVKDSGQGILRDDSRATAPRSLKTLAASRLPQSGAMDAIILTKTNARSRVHRPGYMDYIGVLKFDAEGRPVAEQRFLGLFTSTAYTKRPQDMPLVRLKYESVMRRSGLRRNAYSGKALRHILETLPRDELLQGSPEELFDMAMGVLELKERARPRLFVRRDQYGRFFSCLAFIPRQRFNTTVRHRLERMLCDALHGDSLDSSVLMGESALARLHVVVRPVPGDTPAVDTDALEEELVGIVRNWQDDLRDSLVHELGEIEGLGLANRYGAALPAGYIEEVSADVAAADVQALAQLDDDQAVRMSFYRPQQQPDQLRFKVYRRGVDIPLSDMLPQLENLGLRVLTEHVYDMQVDDARLFIQDFEVRPDGDLLFPVDQVGGHFEGAFENVWRGNAESDGFNRLVLGALLHWRQVAMLRGYCKYLQQVGIAFSQSYMEETLNRYPGIANLLVELFNAKFDPRREQRDEDTLAAHEKQLRGEMDVLVPQSLSVDRAGFINRVVGALRQDRATQIDIYWQAIKVLLDGVASLDDERIIKSYMDVIRATLRTSYFQRPDGAARHYISFKFDSSLVPDAPKPVPYREIFVYGPRVEGIHLRFGAVARGGLRWSDRREDFRTEVLGLVKAQMVKNTVIVPVGSKGGFFVKQPPESGEREDIQAEGVACYRMFIEGLLDITDNLVDGKVVPPQDVVRHDDDDPYLVVAADKGTATFSDIANGIAIDHGYWLGDAFASGGSNGYDHKGMGITAKGAWESVKRHFRALGRDSQGEDFTCVGVGDMSGDVFGNGMLLSRHIRLLAAFDHRHIFLDPNPDAATSYAERERMFALPRSSWEDYDKSLISEGGGVWPRSAKSIPVSEPVRKALGLRNDVEQLSPNELMNAILKAPADLLWNGGIGTYVKASSETHADAGDRANNALRIDGNELRCKVVGEGGNLGLTQKGRIEAALNGVLLNTDFIDNSAGVDTSDHEVNIKILLGDAVHRGELDTDGRNEQLAAMTDEVERLVLWDNYRQNYAITMMEHMAAKRIGSMAHFIRTLEAEGLLDRQVESLPSDAELTERKTRGLGLTRPELSVLLSYDKLKLFQQLLDSDVPEDPYLSRELERYFPEPLREPYAEHMQRHRLKREIIATAVTNSTINRMGATFMMRMAEDTGQGPAAIAKAFTAAREILDARGLWADIEVMDGKVAEDTQIDAKLHIWGLLRHLTRWLLTRPGGTLDIAANVERYQPGMNALREALPKALTPTGCSDFEAGKEKWEGLGMPADLALRLARIPLLRSGLDMIEVSMQSGKPVEQVASVFFGLAGALDLDWLRGQVEALPVESSWHAQARGSLLEELSHQHRALSAQVLGYAGDRYGQEAVSVWLDRDDPTLKHTRAMLADILTQNADYPIASVAVRRLAQLAQMQLD